MHNYYASGLCDWIDSFEENTAHKGSSSKKELTMYDDYKRLRDEHCLDHPVTSKRRLLGVCALCSVAMAWVLGFPAIIMGLLCGHWLIKLSLITYVIYFTVNPLQYCPNFHKWLSDLEIGRENGWKIIVSPKFSEDKEGTYLFISHPHCIYQAGMGFLFVNSTKAREIGIPRVCFCVHWALLWLVPIFKEFFRAVGSVSADASSICKNMKEGQSLVLLPGGSEEVMWAGKKDKEHVVLKHKKGFIKLALRQGLTLVPIFTYGESMGTGVMDLPWFETRLWLTKKFGIPFRYVSLCQRWLLPFPNGILCVAVGEPIRLGHIPKPSKEDLDIAHQKYVKAVLKLVEDTKQEAGYPNLKVEIV